MNISNQFSQILNSIQSIKSEHIVFRNIIYPISSNEKRGYKI